MPRIFIHLYILLILSALVIPKSSFGAEDTTYFDKEWKTCSSEKASYYRPKPPLINGLYPTKDYYNNGQVQMDGHFRSFEPEIKEGAFVFYDRQGNIDGKGSYSNNIKIDTWQYFFKGILVNEEVFSADTSSYKVTLFDSTSGIIKRAGTYRNKKSAGEWRYYTKTGKLNALDVRFDGQLEGCCLTYDTVTGRIRSEVTYSNNVRTGEMSYYDKEGRLLRTVPVVNGKMNGTLKLYNSMTGNLQFTKTAVDNNITGPGVSYFSSCDGISSSGNFVNDKKEGEWKYYHNCTNKLFSIAHYKAGVIDGHYTAYDKTSGMKIIEGEDVNGEENGEWKFYYPGTNQLRMIKHFKNGKYDGEMIGWWPNGKVRRRDVYDNSARTSWNCYTEDGRDTIYYSLKTDAVFMPDPQHFLTNQIVYPEVALEQHLSGKVVVSMHVEMDTHISNVRIVSSTNEVFNEEALRVAYTLPVVSPQLEDGVPFFSDVTMPIKFELPEP